MLAIHSNFEDSVTDTIRILHVDDDPAFLELTEAALQEEGAFDVTGETDPTVALERFDPAAFDAVVSDYEMPELDGLELLETIRAEHPNVPCLVFTGKGSEAVASDAISAGITDYLQKEAGVEQFALLANRVRNAVTQARTTRELRQEKRRRDSILEATPMGIVVHDETGAVTLVNERARSLLGVTADEMNAATYPTETWRLRNHDGSTIDRVSLPFTRVMASEDAVHGLSYTVEREDGTTFDIVVHGTPLRDDDGEPAGAVIVFGQS